MTTKLLLYKGVLFFCLFFGNDIALFAQDVLSLGANFIPSTAVNQLEMWEVDTFDPITIDQELRFAQKTGMNTMRVYLHHVAWQQDPTGFKKSVNQYLRIANKHGIKTMFVFFDDCWRDSYKVGKQPEPIPSVHNSQWLKDPGDLIDREPKLMDTLEMYVKDVMRTFGQDKRVLMWDLYNEPGHFGHGDKSWPLLKNVVRWAREVKATQPITIGVWNGDAKFATFNKFQLQNSDVITFHNYEDTASLKTALDTLTKMGKPVICTEYMKRPNGSTFQNCLAIFKRYNVGAINWGLVAGKTQTNYPQGNKGGEPEPAVWYHDIFRRDGTPFDPGEIKAIRRFVGLKEENPEIQQPVYPAVKRIFVVSDIEGELPGLRKLLLANRVIDLQNSWTFGKCHLVVCGDLFDRGKQVKELLWFLHDLEAKAIKAGGHVHVILGNHDIMNLSGDYRYVDKQYLGADGKPKQEYLSVFSAESVLGKWLRSKNIIKKIGDFLFLHAGISPEVLTTGKSIEVINKECKPFYAASRSLVPDSLKSLFGKNAPFWYRGYFMQPRAGIGLIDSTLAFYGCKKIIVGHTILERNIAMYYGGKVIGIDMDYHAGHSGGLLYENGKWRIAHADGTKKDLVYKPENDTIMDEDIL